MSTIALLSQFVNKISLFVKTMKTDFPKARYDIAFLESKLKTASGANPRMVLDLFMQYFYRLCHNYYKTTVPF